MPHQASAAFTVSPQHALAPFAEGKRGAGRSRSGFSTRAPSGWSSGGRGVEPERPPEGIRPPLFQDLLRAGATAILVQHSRYAMDALQAARALALRVRQSFSPAALGDRPNRGDMAPGLTSFTHPRQEMGAEAVRLPVEILAGGSGPPAKSRGPVPSCRAARWRVRRPPRRDAPWIHAWDGSQSPCSS